MYVSLSASHLRIDSVNYKKNVSVVDRGTFFPRYDAWVSYINRPDIKALPKERVLKSTYCICSDHFVAADFADPNKTKLIWSAVPSAGVSSPRLRCLASEGK